MTLIKVIGFAGNVAFAWACIPTAWRTVVAGRSVGTPIGLAWNIFIACCLFYAYTFLTYQRDPLVWVCGAIEIVCYTIVIWLHYFPWITTGGPVICWLFHRKHHRAVRREGDWSLLSCLYCGKRWGMPRLLEPQYIPVKCEDSEKSV